MQQKRIWKSQILIDLILDLDTSHHLELLYPTCKTKEQRACLFGVLNSCVTSIGKRNLRAQILQPSCELKQIIKTQECIKELFGNQELFVALEETLAKFHSVDKLMKFAVVNSVVSGNCVLFLYSFMTVIFVSSQSDLPNASETMITQIIQLKTCLETVPELNHLLAAINNTYFDDMKMVRYDNLYDDDDGFYLQTSTILTTGFSEHCIQGNAGRNQHCDTSQCSNYRRDNAVFSKLTCCEL